MIKLTELKPNELLATLRAIYINNGFVVGNMRIPEETVSGMLETKDKEIKRVVDIMDSTEERLVSTGFEYYCRNILKATSHVMLWEDKLCDVDVTDDENGEIQQFFDYLHLHAAKIWK